MTSFYNPKPDLGGTPARPPKPRRPASTDPAMCGHPNLVPHPTPKWLERQRRPRGTYEWGDVMRCVDCDLRGEWFPA